MPRETSRTHSCCWKNLLFSWSVQPSTSSTGGRTFSIMCTEWNPKSRNSLVWASWEVWLFDVPIGSWRCHWRCPNTFLNAKRKPIWNTRNNIGFYSRFEMSAWSCFGHNAINRADATKQNGSLNASLLLVFEKKMTADAFPKVWLTIRTIGNAGPERRVHSLSSCAPGPWMPCSTAVQICTIDCCDGFENEPWSGCSWLMKRKKSETVMTCMKSWPPSWSRIDNNAVSDR